MELTIKHRRKNLVYSTDDGGVVVTTIHKNGLSSAQHYAFEIIRKERELYVESSPLFLIFAGLLFLTILAVIRDGTVEPQFPWFNIIILVCLLLILLSLHFLMKKKLYFLKTFQGNFIRFPVAANAKDISSFVDYVIETRNRYLKLKYGTPNEFKSYDSQYSNFNTLLREGVITEEEYKTNLKILSETFRRSAPGSIRPGFSSN